MLMVMSMFVRLLSTPLLGLALVIQEPDLRAERQQFQVQELIPSRTGGWIFPVGTTPKIIWRDVDEVRRLGREAVFKVRWFDVALNEAIEPDRPGRWLAWLEGTAPNGTPFRRSLTFYAFPQKLENNFVLDLSVQFPKFPGADAPVAWREHQSEFDRIGRELVTRALIDSEKGAILIAGLAESQELGRPKKYVESATVANDSVHLALKLKLLGLQDKVRPLQPARRLDVPAAVLRSGAPTEAGVPDDAKQKIDAFCQDWAAASGEPFVTLVARRGVIITHSAFGRLESGEAPSLDYRCWVASITKTVTAIVFSQFVDQGLIQPDAPVSKVFPDYPVDDFHVPTFRQCLNHTSGLGGLPDFGGMHNPHLENVVLNGIDILEPGKTHAYTGLGFELVAKAMEVVSGKSAVRLYSEHLFQPLGFGDVVLGNASSDGEFTAWELAVLGQWLAQQGSYGDREFVSSTAFAELLPRPTGIVGAMDEQGLGLHPVRHWRPGASTGSKAPEDLLFGPRTIGHGSFSGCILVVDPDQQLVIVQVRKKFAPEDQDWYTRFFQTIAAAFGR